MKMLARRERSQQKEDTFLLKRILYIFSITLRLRDRHIFCMEKATGDFERFLCFNFETAFLEKENLC